MTLERRTPLKRGTSQLKRTPLKSVGKRGRAHERVMRKLRPQARARDGNRCRALFSPTCTGRPDQAHHIWPTEAGGPDVLENLLTVCAGPGSCHDWIHNVDPAEAEARGLLRRRG